MQRINKPEPGENARYAAMYIDLLPDDGRVLESLQQNFETTRDLAEDADAASTELADQLVVGCVRANPEPGDPVAFA